MAAAVEVTDIGLAHDCDNRFLGGVCILGVAGRSSDSNGEKSGKKKLYRKMTYL